MNNNRSKIYDKEVNDAEKAFTRAQSDDKCYCSLNKDISKLSIPINLSLYNLIWILKTYINTKGVEPLIIISPRTTKNRIFQLDF